MDEIDVKYKTLARNRTIQSYYLPGAQYITPQQLWFTSHWNNKPNFKNIGADYYWPVNQVTKNDDSLYYDAAYLDQTRFFLEPNRTVGLWIDSL